MTLRVFVTGWVIFFSFTIFSGQSKSSAETPTQAPVKTFIGTLQTGMVAIGGETTGTELVTDSGERYELAFNDRTKLAMLKGKRVKVKGVLNLTPGVEIAIRRVIEVKSIRALKK